MLWVNLGEPLTTKDEDIGPLKGKKYPKLYFETAQSYKFPTKVSFTMFQIINNVTWHELYHSVTKILSHDYKEPTHELGYQETLLQS